MLNYIRQSESPCVVVASHNGAQRASSKRTPPVKTGRSDAVFATQCADSRLTCRAIIKLMEKKTRNTRDLYYSSPARGEKKVAFSSAFISCAIALAVGIVAGLSFNALDKNFDGSTKDINFDSLNEVYQSLEANYDGEVDRQKVLEEAKRGLVNAVADPYSYYMTAEEYREFDDSLNGNVGAGIGVEISMRENFVKVMRTTKDNPAREAGILAGDIIYKVDDKEMTGLSTEEVANALRGEEGSEVKVTVVRDGEEKDFTLTREIINDESVYVEYRDDNKTAILTISRFDQETGALAEKAAEEIKEKGVEKIILDLRGNGGGYVNAAVDVASLWLDGQLVTTSKSSKHEEYDKEYNAKTGRATLKDIKTIVLTNGSTASAAEILSGALKDHGKATLVGETTFGKGCMQVLERLSNGDVLRVTIANWYTPKGDNISKGGLEPDEKVERTYDQINHEEDPQLDRALEM